MGEYRDIHGIRNFTPDDTDTVLYIRSSVLIGTT